MSSLPNPLSHCRVFPACAAALALMVASAPAQNLVGLWKFDETSGQTAVESANGYDGQLGTTAGADAADPAVNQAGQFGTAYSFDGGDRVDASAHVGNFSSLATGSITLWFNANASSSARRALFSLNTGSTDRIAFELNGAANDGKLLFLVREANANIVQLRTNATFEGAWHHLAVTQDGTAAKIYIDGVEITDFETTGQANSDAWFDDVTGLTQLWLGDDNTAGPWNGLIDDVAIFDDALDPTQIGNVMTAGAESFNIDETPPSIASLDPDGSAAANPGTDLVATFDEDIVLTGGGTITITDTGDGSGTMIINLPDPTQVSVSGRDLIINPTADLEAGAPFEVTISAGAIEDDAIPANAFDGTTSGQWTFSTPEPDLTPPVILTKSPDDNDLDVSRNSNIVATFDDEIVAGAGDIILEDLTDGSTTRTIAVTDSSQITIAGSLLTIDPASVLAPATDYAVHIAPGAVKNTSDVSFAGILETDTTTWNFRTAESSPNVIFILGDDQAWFDYSFMYRPEVEKAAIDSDSSIFQAAQTPALDSLADQSLTFTHGYSTPICRPSLASIITGAFPHRTLITGNDADRGGDTAIEARMQVLNPLPRTLAKELGYTSFQTGKWWEGHHTNGGFTSGDTVNSLEAGTEPTQWSGGKTSYLAARHGDWGLMTGRVDYVNDVAKPEHWDAINGERINYANTVQTVTDFIDAQVTAEQPFFLWYAPFLPHNPFDAPPALKAKYDALITEPDETGDWIADYYANIERFDGGVGAILDHLDAQGIADDTIVIFICDNGWINRTTSRYYADKSKQSPYEGGIRTPVMVRWPDKIKLGGEIEPQFITTPVSLVDLVPTVHDALNLPTYPEMTGVSLLDLDAVNARPTVFTEDSNQDIFNLNDPSTALQARIARRGGWKLILNVNGTKELYHLYDEDTGAPVDPHETDNLAASHPEIVSDLSVAIVNWYAVQPNEFDSWISDSALGIPSGERGFNLDPDGDKLSNGLEAWFGTHPGEFNAGLANLATGGTITTFTHPRSENPPSDLVGYYEWSPNLVDWYPSGGGPGGGPTVSMEASTAGTTTTVTATASEPMEKIFLRAGVSQL